MNQRAQAMMAMFAKGAELFEAAQTYRSALVTYSETHRMHETMALVGIDHPELAERDQLLEGIVHSCAGRLLTIAETP